MSAPVVRDAPETPPRRWHAILGVLVAAAAVAAFHLWFYGDALGAFFFLDDFWELAKTNSIAVTSPSDFLRLFEPYPHFLLYRPLTTLVFYHLLRVAFGYDPFWYHATLIAFHVFNGVLVYLIARRLFESTRAGLMTALVYAMAPGHAIAVYWMALFTMTGTAFFYFWALATWFCMAGRWRIPVTWLLFVAAMLSSEHAISLPIMLTAASLLVDRSRDWRRIGNEQWPFYFVAVAYAAVKLYYIRYHPPALPSNDYALQFDPTNIVEQLGGYLGFGINLAFDPQRSPAVAQGLGMLVLLLAIGATLWVLWRPSTQRPLRVAAFGLVLFGCSLGPVIFLPHHQQPYYVGIAALGLALAAVGALRTVRIGSSPDLAAFAFTACLLGTHALRADALVRQTLQFRYFDGGSESAAAWLYSVWSYAESGRVSEFVVPEDSVSHQVFGKVDGEHKASTFLVCPWYQVRQSRDLANEAPAPGRMILHKPRKLPEQRSARRSWEWLQQACPDCSSCGTSAEPCPPACFRRALQKRALQE